MYGFFMNTNNQPYLCFLYRAILSTAYYGLFRVGELTKGEHPVLAKDIFIANNKNKMLFILRTSKTHWTDSKPQRVKITSSGNSHKRNCPFEICREYINRRPKYNRDNEPFFIFSDRTAVEPKHINAILKLTLKIAKFDNRFYSTHSMRVGRTMDLFKAGLSVETIQKIGRWKWNAVYKYLS